MTTIAVVAHDQRLSIVQKPLLASGDMETVIMHADFSSEWDGYSKTAVFYQDEANVYHAVLNGSGECVIPWEVLQDEGILYFGIFGAKNGTRKTSEVIRYRIKKGSWSEETAISDPTPDIYTQILSSIATITPAQIGAAPASGFVSRNYVKNVEALNAWIDELVAAQDVGTEKTYYTTLEWSQAAPLPTGRWSITIHKPDVSTEPTWAGVTATVIASKRIHKLCRELYSGTWFDWEWENPYVELGKEYRTTERWQGKAVYTILANIGALPNAKASDSVTISSVTGVTDVIRDALTIRSTSSGRTFTGDHALTHWSGVNAANKIYCQTKCSNDLSAYEGIMQVWYTKD